MDEEGWTDLGEQASIWGGIDGGHTCLTAISKRPTRRDYILVNPALLGQVTNFRVVKNPEMQRVRRCSSKCAEVENPSPPRMHANLGL